MSHDIRRSRSNTSMSTHSNRPLSRASTTSINSFEQHSQTHNGQTQYPQQPPQQTHYQHPLSNSFSAEYPPLEAALLQVAQHAQQSEDISLDSMQQLMAYSAQPPHSMSQHNGLPTDQQPFDVNHGHVIHHTADQLPPPPSAPIEVEEKKKKGSASGSATNDKELRAMLAQNQGRVLQDVAAEVIATDRTSKAEKSKQLFAMLWLKAVCKTSKKSVPRNRVFSKYAQRCGDERVIPLNPASFGKLVRVIFPGIQTRRLGVRGESKYHYVDLELINDAEDDGARRPSTAYSHQPGLQGQGSVPPKLNFNHISEISADTAAFRPQDQIPESQSSRFSQTASKGRLFTNIYSEEFHSHTGRRISESYDYELRFATPEQLAPEDNGAIILPDIISYLPPNTDPDSANALVALYRTHCTSLIDSVRYCKEKQFFRLYTSFHGTLTVPVQKLFAQQEIAPWIRECDWMMYQKMIRNVAQLTLQVAPQQVLKFLDNVEKMLRPHLVKVCSGLPTHVLESRLEPATLFTHLLRQMQRVNSTAHAAAVLLMGDQNRDQMWADWVRLVNVKRIIENELPQSCDHEEVYNILKTEMRAMLLPLREGVWMADGSFFPTQAETSPDCTNDTVIDRIALFLTRLPARFPHLSARMMLHCINAIGSAALREITVENGQSFQGWWLTKVFVDEMGQWLASLGGFLGHSPPAWSPTSLSPGTMNESVQNNMVNAESGSNNNSRYSSIDAEYGPNQSFMSNTNGHVQERGNVNPGISSRRNTGQYDHMSFNMEYDMATSQQELSHDDSGIALLDDTIEVKLTPNFQQSLATQLGQIPTQHPSGGVIN